MSSLGMGLVAFRDKSKKASRCAQAIGNVHRAMWLSSTGTKNALDVALPNPAKVAEMAATEEDEAGADDHQATTVFAIAAVAAAVVAGAKMTDAAVVTGVAVGGVVLPVVLVRLIINVDRGLAMDVSQIL
mmetsp:Transcript_36108/g.59425  ORF Transcript_36108/g.59425 Transcript_36108/m.59425 type:complete len:130 (+) Transcript_36108:296-685(+)